MDKLIANVWKEMQPDYIAKYNEIESDLILRKPNAFLIYLKGLKFFVAVIRF